MSAEMLHHVSIIAQINWLNWWQQEVVVCQDMLFVITAAHSIEIIFA